MPLITFVFIAECKNYKSLTDSTRKLNVPANNATKKADRPGDSFTSVDWQGVGWYRVMGGAGTRIPENPFTSVQSIGCLVGICCGYCNTCCPGYLPSGSHPQTPGQLVYNVTVCYNCLNHLCNPRSDHTVKIRHCGDYFVYYLTDATSVFQIFRYCTE